MRWFRSEIQHILFELRERPEDWFISDNAYKLIHSPTGLSIWLSRHFEGLYEPKAARFKLRDRVVFRRAIKGWKETERKARLRDAFEDAEVEKARQQAVYGRSYSQF